MPKANLYFPKINLNDFFYELPKDRIAEYPLENREDSKLLFADATTSDIRHYNFFELPALLKFDSLILYNNTKVIAARLHFWKATGGKVEILLIEPLSPSTDPQIVMSSDKSCVWKCIIGGKRVHESAVFELNHEGVSLTAEIMSRTTNEAEVLFSWNNKLSFAEVIGLFGKIPLPPYIKMETEEVDKDRYQTVYANLNGSVAAPTAGLHFTEGIIGNLKNNGIGFAGVTLHVGPGTFLPIENDNLAEHKMHEEQFFVTKETLSVLKRHIEGGNRIIATGTTTLRTIESLYWLGTKLIAGKNENEDEFFLDQFEPYQLENTVSLPEPQAAISELIKYLESNRLDFVHCRTRLLVVPGYHFKIINGLITNYHIPKSTLILLVAAFIGQDLQKKVYSEALSSGYRFLSYGDTSLLFR